MPQFVSSISSQKNFSFCGKMPGMSSGAQELVDPYIGGHIPAGELMSNLKHGAFRAGLVGVLDGIYYRVVATGHDSSSAPGWNETAWALVPIGKTPPAGLVTTIL